MSPKYDKPDNKTYHRGHFHAPHHPRLKGECCGQKAIHGNAAEESDGGVEVDVEEEAHDLAEEIAELPVLNGSVSDPGGEGKDVHEV